MRLLMLLAVFVPGGAYMLPVALMRRHMEVRPEIAEEVPVWRMDDVQEVALDVCPPREPRWIFLPQCHENQTTTTSVLSEDHLEDEHRQACHLEDGGSRLAIDGIAIFDYLDKAVVCALALVVVSFFAARLLRRRTVVAYARKEEALQRKAGLKEIEVASKEQAKREKEEARDEERRGKEEQQRKKLELENQESAKAEKKRLKAAAEEERKKQEEAKAQNDMAFPFSFFEATYLTPQDSKKNEEAPTWRAPGPDESGGWEEWKESEPPMDKPVPICNVLTPSKQVRRMAAARPVLYLGSGTPPPRPVILDGDDDDDK